jgi:hypothetical protein
MFHLVVPKYRRLGKFKLFSLFCKTLLAPGFVMNHLLYLILLLVSRMFLPRYNARLQLLIAQIRMLRARIDSGRIVPTLEEKAELLRLGTLMDHNIRDVMHIV